VGTGGAYVISLGTMRMSHGDERFVGFDALES
jgi:hypothetical protein